MGNDTTFIQFMYSCICICRSPVPSVAYRSESTISVLPQNVGLLSTMRFRGISVLERPRPQLSCSLEQSKCFWLWGQNIPVSLSNILSSSCSWAHSIKNFPNSLSLLAAPPHLLTHLMPVSLSGKAPAIVCNCKPVAIGGEEEGYVMSWL